MPDWPLVEFEWDDSNVDHLFDRHGIEPEQAVQVFANRPAVRRGRKVSTATGHDDRGHELFVVFETRNGVVRVISVRPITAQERPSYVRHRGS